MRWHVRDVLAFGCALALATMATKSVRAEFPPEGAVTDPHNPSIASGDVPDPAHKDVTRHFIFYFDCGKRDWIGVTVTNSEGQAPPQAIGMGREFPSGPPTGSKTVPGDSNRAIVAATGQTLLRDKGRWFDLKSKRQIRSPDLCPKGVVPSENHSSPQGAGSIESAQTPPGPIPKGDQKPNQLPPPPQYNPSRLK